MDKHPVTKTNLYNLHRKDFFLLTVFPLRCGAAVFGVPPLAACEDVLVDLGGNDCKVRMLLCSTNIVPHIYESKR